jgi:hypothetical protein
VDEHACENRRRDTDGHQPARRAQREREVDERERRREEDERRQRHVGPFGHARQPRRDEVVRDERRGERGGVREPLDQAAGWDGAGAAAISTAEAPTTTSRPP